MKRALLVLLTVLLAVSVYAQLYADVTFDVKDTGEVVISGNTNYEPFTGTTNTLTSKQGDMWFLNITSPVFEEYIYHVKLPQYAVINYIKANSKVRIEESSGSIIITGTGSKKPIDIRVQYSINKAQQTNSSLTLIGAIILIIVVGIVAFLVQKRLSKHKKIPEKAFKRELYTERQLVILDYIKKHGTVTQAKLEHDLKLPKSSLSRNIQTLVQKGVLFKETHGMSNVIGFKE